LCFGVADQGQAPPLAIDGAKGIPAIESFILARLFMFQQVYFHKTERASEWMMARIFGEVAKMLAEGEPLSATPAAIVSLAQGGDATLADYLELDDASLWVALSAWRNSKNPILSDLSRRFHARKLFKTYELFDERATPEARVEALDIARDIAEKAGLDPQIYVGLDAASTVAFDDIHDPLTVMFPGGKTRALADVSFLLGRLRGEKMSRIRLIFAPELRDDIIRALATG
jgi:HD superfamily phosphohydrolase